MDLVGLEAPAAVSRPKVCSCGAHVGSSHEEDQYSPQRSLYAPVLWAGSALRNELNLIITIDADLPTPQTPPSPPILMRGGMERPVWCFHPQGLG